MCFWSRSNTSEIAWVLMNMVGDVFHPLSGSTLASEPQGPALGPWHF